MVYGGKTVDRRQVVELKGLRNDDGLLRHEQLVLVPKGHEFVKCGECGAEFMEEATRTVHGDLRH
jgi:hypothetical protein